MSAGGLEPAAAPAGLSLADRLDGFLERLTDRVNPLVIKEVRQRLRTRVFWIVQSLLLVAALIISIVAYLQVQVGSDEPKGPVFFTAFYACLAIVLFLVLPFGAYLSMMREREEETWSLLLLTGMSARQVLRGKLVSAGVQGALYGSVLLPFLLLSYFLNGIDVPTMLLIIALGGVLHAFLLVAATCAGTLAENRLFRWSLQILVFLSLFWATWSALFFAGMMTSSAGQGRWTDAGFGIGVGLLLLGSTGVLLYQIAIARLSTGVRPYVAGPRAAIALQLCVFAGLFGWGWLEDGRGSDWALALQLCLCVYLAVCANFLVNAREGPRPSGRARVFGAGFLGNLRFVVLCVLGVAVAATVLFSLSVTHRTEVGRGWAIAATGGYLLVYLAGSVLIGRLGPRALRESVIARRVLLPLLLVIGGLIPLLVGTAFFGDPLVRSVNVLNPFVALPKMALAESTFIESWTEGGAVAWGMVALGLLLTLAADRVLAARERAAAGP